MAATKPTRVGDVRVTVVARVSRAADRIAATKATKATEVTAATVLRVVIAVIARKAVIGVTDPTTGTGAIAIRVAAVDRAASRASAVRFQTIVRST